eukprot:jgi/Chrzof1/3606/Cz13g02040.t1
MPSRGGTLHVSKAAEPFKVGVLGMMLYVAHLSKEELQQRKVSVTTRRSGIMVPFIGQLQSQEQVQAGTLVLGPILGQGSTGIVHAGEVNGKPAAMKLLVADDEDARHRLQTELDLLEGPLKPLQGQVVPTVLASGRTVAGSTPFIAMELLADSTYENLQLSADDEEQILHGLRQIHAQGVLHGDIREANILAP